MDKKHLELLDFLLIRLCSSRPSGTSFRNILRAYEVETGNSFDSVEISNFLALYENKYFNKIGGTIDRLIVTQSARQIINDHGSLTEYFNQQEILRLQEEQERQNQKPIIVIQSSPSSSNTKNMHRNTRAITKPIAMLSPVVKFIFAIIIAGLGTLLGYILIEWVKTL